jgi:hypothetical protein
VEWLQDWSKTARELALQTKTFIPGNTVSSVKGRSDIPVFSLDERNNAGALLSIPSGTGSGFSTCWASTEATSPWTASNCQGARFTFCNERAAGYGVRYCIFFDRLMLPEPKSCPADLGDVLADPSVTRAVAFDLLHPEGGVLLHKWRMDVAPMPKAAVEKKAILSLGTAISHVMRFISFREPDNQPDNEFLSRRAAILSKPRTDCRARACAACVDGQMALLRDP